MDRSGTLYAVGTILAFLIAVPIEAVTVSPSLCPTNKIAPHKRIANWQYGSGRTFGAFYDLLVPGSPQYGAPNYDNDLQEQPQEDDPTDCGEIDDYDENDLSSITPQQYRRQDHQDSQRFFFKPQNPQFPSPPNFPSFPNFPHLPNRPQRPPKPPQRPPSNYPQRPPRPPSTNRPQGPSYPATKPPYWSGGLFGSNDYRPPLHQNPSDTLKPIHEDSETSQVPYRPSLVGGLLGHVVGFSPIVPTSQDEPTTSRTFYNRLRPSTPPPITMVYPTRRPRPRNINNNGIFGSFVDLLF